MKIRLVSVVVLLVAVVRAMAAEPKTCGVYSSIVSFAGHNAMEAAIKSDPSFLKDKHKKSFAGSNNAGEAKAVQIGRGVKGAQVLNAEKIVGRDRWFKSD